MESHIIIWCKVYVFNFESVFKQNKNQKLYNIVKNPATYFEVPTICFMLEEPFAVIWKYIVS